MKESRMPYVDKWARFVIEHSDKEWSSLQKELIDSQIENAQKVRLVKEQVARIQNSKHKL